MKSLIIFTLTMCLTSCASDKDKPESGSILCKTEDKTAYSVRPGLGDISYLYREPKFDPICKDVKALSEAIGVVNEPR